VSGTSRGPVELSAGCRLGLAGIQWQVRQFEPHTGRVLLCRDDGQELVTTVRALVSRGDCRPAPAAGASSPHSRGRQPAGLEDLTARQRELTAMRYAHLMEAETGYRSGSPLHALPGEPRPAYDPAATTLHQRRLAKVAEMAGLGADSAAVLGLARISERTLARWAGQCRRSGIAGCIDGNWLRRGGERPSITEQVREAIYAVHGECLHRSRVSMATKDRLIRQYVREKSGPEVAVPSYWTLRRAWAGWFGPGGARQRYARSAAKLPVTGEHVVIHRPGQVVALDTSPLGVKVREHAFGEPVTAWLTLALDLYTHSLVAFRLTLVSDTSVDVAMLLRDVMMPLPLRADWGQDMEWPYPGIPASLVASFAGHQVAGLPFFAPETVTTDHGSVYKNHHLIEVQRVIGANILPARVLRPTDKPRVAYCTSSGRSGGVWCSCWSGPAGAAADFRPVRRAGGVGRVVEELSFVVISGAGDNSRPAPGFDRVVADAVGGGELGEGEHAGGAEALAAAG
jgi:hypothetical protein